MTEQIIIQLIIGIVTVVTTAITVTTQSGKTQYRIDQLEKKVEKHNNLIERVYKLEQKIEDLEP